MIRDNISHHSLGMDLNFVSDTLQLTDALPVEGKSRIADNVGIRESRV